MMASSQNVRREDPPSEGRAGRVRTLFGLASSGLLVLAVVSVGDSDLAAFPGSATDLDELGRVVFEALQSGDGDALEAVRLSEQEHNEVVYPELPAARAANPFPVELAWGNIQMRNSRALRRVGGWYRGRPQATYLDTRCAGRTQSFDSFRVMTDCTQTFEIEGRLYEVQLYKDILVRRGGHKIFRYYDDRAQALASR